MNDNKEIKRIFVDTVASDEHIYIEFEDGKVKEFEKDGKITKGTQNYKLY